MDRSQPKAGTSTNPKVLRRSTSDSATTPGTKAHALAQARETPLMGRKIAVVSSKKAGTSSRTSTEGSTPSLHVSNTSLTSLDEEGNLVVHPGEAGEACKVITDIQVALSSKASGNLNRRVKEYVDIKLHRVQEMILRQQDINTRLQEQNSSLEIDNQRLKRELDLEAKKYAHTLERSVGQQVVDIKSLEVAQAKTVERLELLTQQMEAHYQYTRDSVVAPINKVKSLVEGVATNVEKGEQDLAGSNLATTSKLLLDLVENLQADVTQNRPAPVDVTGLLPPEDDEGGKWQLVRPRRAARRDAITQPPPKEIPAVPKHTILVESIDPHHTGLQVVEKIKHDVDVVQMGVGIAGVRRCKNGKVAITVNSIQERQLMENAIRESGGLTVTVPPPKKPLLRLLGVVPGMDDARIREAILKQNSDLVGGIPQSNQALSVVRRTKGRHNQVQNIIVECSPDIWNALRDQRIRLGYQVVMAVDQSPLLQCFRCLGFSHRARECKAPEARCGYCSAAHETRDCTNREGAPRCTNCSAKQVAEARCSHPAYSASCPEWVNWDRLARAGVSYC